MSEIRQYLKILIESLEKKEKLLQAVLEENKKQESAIKQNSSLEEFDQGITRKNRLIRQLLDLDSGFEKVYDRIKEELTADRELYREEIGSMQEQIQRITNLSVRIQATEQRNKKLVEGYFSNAKQQIGQAKKSIRVASDYYKSMSGSGYGGSSMIDQKK